MPVKHLQQIVLVPFIASGATPKLVQVIQNGLGLQRQSGRLPGKTLEMFLVCLYGSLLGLTILPIAQETFNHIHSQDRGVGLGRLFL